MKLSEMNARQKKAFYNVVHASNFLIGGLENTMLDNSEDTEAYQDAEKLLADHEALKATIYDMAINDIYGDGFCQVGEEVKKYLKDIRFCGKEFIMERIEKRLVKMGY